MWLTVINGRDAGKTVEITGERFRIGRSRDCDLVLRDRAVEPVHAEFRRESRAWVVADLGSQSGTFVQTKRIKRPVELRGTEELCFGETFARLSPMRPAGTRSRRPSLAIVAAVAVAVGAAGVTAAILAPRVGGSESATTLALPAPSIEVSTSEAAQEGSEVPPSAAGEGRAEQPTAVSDSGATETSSEPVVVFRDDFSDPRSGWEVFQETAAWGRYEDGAYVLGITDSTFFATADSGRSFPDPRVSVSVENPTRAPKAGLGIVCGYRDQSNFYLLGVGTDGTAAIVRSQDGELTVLTGNGQWVRVPEIPLAAPRYRLRARCGDGGLVLAVNGRRVLAARAPEPKGTVGLFAAGAVELRFDDFVVRSAQA